MDSEMNEEDRPCTHDKAKRIKEIMDSMPGAFKEGPLIPVLSQTIPKKPKPKSTGDMNARESQPG